MDIENSGQGEEILQPENEEVMEDQIVSNELENQELEQDQEDTRAWVKDKRYGQMWKTEDDLYKSYTQMEQMYAPLKKEHETFKSKIQDYEQRINSFSELQKVAEFIDSNPKYQEAVLKAVQQAKEEETRLKYGDLPPEAIAKLERAERISNELEQVKREREIEGIKTQISSNLAEISKIAEEYGLEYDENEFKQYCLSIGLNDPKYMKSIFMEKAVPMLLKAEKEKQAITTSASIAANRKSSILGRNNRTQSSSKAKSLDERLSEAFDR